MTVDTNLPGMQFYCANELTEQDVHQPDRAAQRRAGPDAPETSLTAKESPMQIFYFTPLFSPFIACAARINK